MTRGNSDDPTPYAVNCKNCMILRFLTEAQYQRQLSKPDSLWTCPVCGEVAQWDDDCQATNPPFEELEEEEIEDVEGTGDEA